MNANEAKKLIGARAQETLDQVKALHGASSKRNDNHTPAVAMMAYARFAPRAEDFEGEVLEVLGDRALMAWQVEVAADFERLRSSALEYREISLDAIGYVKDRMKSIGRAVIEDVRASADAEKAEAEKAE